MSRQLIRMPTISNVMQLLNAKTAAKFGTTSKSLKSLAHHRLAPIRARHNVSSMKAARLGRVRYKSNKMSQNLNKIYKSLKAVGMLNAVLNSDIYKNLNNQIKTYGYLRNVTITQKEQDRLIRKIIKMKAILVNKLKERHKQYKNLYNRSILSPSSHGSTPNFT